MKTVSIILPTYNGADYIRESIRTCLEQTHSAIELVIVDDCSTDETPRILQDYAADARVKVIRHPQNAKLPTALNTGFAQATGDYLTWTSDDNLFVPTAIEEMVAYLEEHPQVGFVYTDYDLIDEDGSLIRRVEAGPPDHLRERCAITSFLYRREVYEAVGDYDPKLFRIEDYDYWLRVAQHFNLAWYPKSLYLYRRHSGSLTSNDHLENRAEMFDKINAKYYGPDPTRKNRVLTDFYIAEAFESHERGERRNVLNYAFKAIRRDLSILNNRGVWSIMIQAVFGRRLVAFVTKPIIKLIIQAQLKAGLVWLAGQQIGYLNFLEKPFLF